MPLNVALFRKAPAKVAEMHGTGSDTVGARATPMSERSRFSSHVKILAAATNDAWRRDEKRRNPKRGRYGDRQGVDIAR